MLMSLCCHRGNLKFTRPASRQPKCRESGDFWQNSTSSVPPVRRLTLSFVTALLAIAGVLEVVPVTTASAVSHTRAQLLLSDALNAAQAKGSMHFVDKTTVNNTTTTLEGAISAPTAGETLSGGSAPLEVELIGGVMYVTGNASALEQSLQITAAQAQPYAGKWLIVHSSDAPFQLLASDLTVAATIDVFTPAQSGLKIGKTQKIGKTKAIPLVGRPSTLPQGTSGSVALFVSPKAPHVPLGGSLIIANHSGRLSEIAVFNDWGDKVNLTPPSGGVNFSNVLS